MFPRNRNSFGGVAAFIYYALPPALCVLLYRVAFTAWFQQDDFVWLTLRVDSFSSLVATLFVPTPHGTLRPFGDRGFFLLLKSVAGLHALPYHLVVFLFQIANLALLASLVRRLTGFTSAGFLAAILWIVHPALVLPMVWISGVYQVMGGFCFLVALRMFVSYAHGGRPRDLLWTWIAFLAGLGVIETMVVFPLMAASYAAFYARQRMRQSLLMVAVSIMFVVVRLAMIQPRTAGPYALHLDSSLMVTLAAYWKVAVGGGGAVRLIVGGGVTVALAVFVIRRFRRRDFVPTILLGWCLLALGPVLPIRDHVTDYYLTVPLMGLAGLAAYAVTRVFEGPAAIAIPRRVVATVVVALNIVVSIDAVEFAARWWTLRSRRVETTFAAVVEANRRQPGRVILLENVDNDLFWSCVLYRPFKLAGIRDVYLAPGSEAQVKITAGLPPLTDWMIAVPVALELQAANRLIVLRLVDDRFVDVTETWTVAGVPSA